MRRLVVFPGGFGEPAQCLSDYVTCLRTLDVQGLLLLTFLGKWLVFGGIALLLLFFMRLGRGILIPSGVIFAFFWLGYFLWRGISDSSLYRLLRYLNLYYFLRPDMAVGVYRNLNLCGYPVACRAIWSAAVVGMMAGGTALLAATRQMRPRGTGKKAIFWAQWRGKAGRRKKAPHVWAKRLLAAEFYKAWRMRRILLVSVIAAGFQIWNYSGKEWFQGAAVRMTGHEYQSGMRGMLRTMSSSGRRYFTDKILVLASVCLAVLLIAYAPDLWLVGRIWGWDSACPICYTISAGRPTVSGDC